MSFTVACPCCRKQIAIQVDIFLAGHVSAHKRGREEETESVDADEIGPALKKKVFGFKFEELSEIDDTNASTPPTYIQESGILSAEVDDIFDDFSNDGPPPASQKYFLREDRDIKLSNLERK